MATGRVVLITGAGSGVGRQLALEFAGRGCAIAALDLREEGLTSLAKELAGKPVAWALADVNDRDSLTRAVARLKEQLGPADILIASAGIGIETSALAYRAEDVEAVIRVNLIGVSNSIGAVLPDMLARRTGQLVAISSLASFRGLPKLAAYSASKAGVNALLDGLRVELRGHGITVTTVCPGFIRTPMTAELEARQVPMLDVAYAAGRIAEAIERRQAFVAFPWRPARWLGLLRWLPLSWSDWIIERYALKLADKGMPSGVSKTSDGPPMHKSSHD